MSQNLLALHTVGLKELQRDFARSANPMQLAKARKRGLKKATTVVMRRAKKEYLRKGNSSAISSRAASFFRERRLGRLTGNLASDLTFKVVENRNQAQVGWWSHPYAGVVAEPPDNRTVTVIRPRTAKALWFPLTKRARNAWSMIKTAESWTGKSGGRKGKKGLKIGSKTLWFGEDYTIASQVKIRPRHPLRRSLADEIDTINRVMFHEYEVLGKKLR